MAISAAAAKAMASGAAPLPASTATTSALDSDPSGADRATTFTPEANKRGGNKGASPAEQTAALSPWSSIFSITNQLRGVGTTGRK